MMLRAARARTLPPQRDADEHVPPCLGTYHVFSIAHSSGARKRDARGHAVSLDIEAARG